MRSSSPLVLLVLLLSIRTAAAQDTQNAAATTSRAQVASESPAAPLAKGATEWMIAAGLAHGVVVFYSAAGHRFALQTVSWARVLTDSHLPGFLRGRFAWALEAVPVFA